SGSSRRRRRRHCAPLRPGGQNRRKAGWARCRCLAESWQRNSERMTAKMSVLQFRVVPGGSRRPVPGQRLFQGAVPGRGVRAMAIPVFAVLLASCASVDIEEPGTAMPPEVDITQQPLKVPPLEALRDTPERPLAGRFVPVGWAALPSWADDDLSRLWPVFINNCKGLMRPTGGSAVQQARATPRAWQPVCAAAAQAAPQTGAQVRAFIEQHLQPWRLLDEQGKPARNTVTGYYEPLVRGARKQGGAYQWP